MAVDLLALAEEDGFKTVRHSTSRGGQYNGTCPWCCGHDRFRIQPNTGQYGFFACSQCGRKGSAVDYLIGKRGLSKMDALLEVGWKPKDGSEPRFILPAYALDERASWDEPPAQWQGAALDFALQSQKTLWGDQGRVALDYLRSRAFSDETIKKAMLGYHPAESWGPAREWGRNIKLWAGIVIPWLETGQGAIKVWRITVRSLAATDENRYKLVSSGSNGLYLVDSLKLKRSVVVMTEGEFDALSVAQECGDLVAVVATGTTEGSHTPRWVAALATQPKVAVAFDAEKDKGDAAADWWLQRLSNAQRLRPYWKDANQMLQDGVSLRDWTRPTVVSHDAPFSVPIDEPVAPAPASPASPPEEHEPVAPVFREKVVYRSYGHAHRTSIPAWLIPGTYDWNKQVERNGLAEMQERRAAWFEQKERATA